MSDAPCWGCMRHVDDCPDWYAAVKKTYECFDVMRTRMRGHVPEHCIDALFLDMYDMLCTTTQRLVPWPAASVAAHFETHCLSAAAVQERLARARATMVVRDRANATLAEARCIVDASRWDAEELVRRAMERVVLG